MRHKLSIGRGSLVAGIAASLIWGLSPALVRTIGEQLGIFTTGMLISFIGGGIVLIYKFFVYKSLKAPVFRLNYWLICGGSYLLFTVATNLSVGFSANREQVVSAGLFRLLWPLMTLMMTIPIHGAKVKKTFFLAVLLCLFGVVLPNIGAENITLGKFFLNLKQAWFPSLLGLLSSISWGIYSNFYTRFIDNSQEDHIGFFMVLTGIVQLFCSRLIDPKPLFATNNLGALVFLIGTSFLANLAWNVAMRGSYNIQVILFSNLLPVISTIATSLFLGVKLTIPLILGSLLVVVGTLWSKKSFAERL